MVENGGNVVGKQAQLDKQYDKQLPFLNDLKSRINGLQIDETRFTDDLMQKKPSNLMKSSPVYSSHLNYNLQSHLQPKLHANQLSASHLNNKTSPRKHSNNHNLVNFSPLNNHLNQTSLYFNPQKSLQSLPSITQHQAPSINNLKTLHSYPPTVGNHHLLNSSNIYCSIGRPTHHLKSSSSSNVLYNSGAQPLIILPKAKRKK